jgi:hypothetical protein
VSVEGTDVHEKDEGNIVAVDCLRDGTIVGDVLVGGGEIRVVELSKRGDIVPGSAASVGIVPCPIIESIVTSAIWKWLAFSQLRTSRCFSKVSPSFR